MSPRESLLREADAMWRGYYGEELSDEDCAALTRRLLSLYRIELPEEPRNRRASAGVKDLERCP